MWCASKKDIEDTGLKLSSLQEQLESRGEKVTQSQVEILRAEIASKFDILRKELVEGKVAGVQRTPLKLLGEKGTRECWMVNFNDDHQPNPEKLEDAFVRTTTGAEQHCKYLMEMISFARAQQEDLKRKQTALSMTTEQLKEAHGTIAELREQLTQLDVEKKHGATDAKYFQDQHGELEKKLNVMKTEIETVKKMHKFDKDELGRVQEQHKTDLENHHGELARREEQHRRELENHMADLARTEERHKKDLEDHKEQHKHELENRMADLARKEEQHKKDLENHKAELSRKEEQHNTVLESKKLELERMQAQHTNVLENKKLELERMQEARRQDVEKNALLEQTLESHKSTQATREEELSARVAELEAYKRDHEKEKSTLIKELTDKEAQEKKRMQDEIDRLQHLIAQKESENKDLKIRHEEHREKSKAIQAAVSHLQPVNTRHRVEIDNIVEEAKKTMGRTRTSTSGQTAAEFTSTETDDR